MDDLARELGMSKKTFYQHFANKNSLLEAVMRMKFAEVDADLSAATVRSDKDFPAALHQLLVCLQRHTAELQPAFVRDVRKSAPEFFQRVQARRQDMIQRHFTKLLSAGRKVGIIRKDIPLAVAIEILLGATQTVVNPAKVAELDLTPKSAFTAVISVFLEGMITAKGRMKL
jgi:AcrR family transcriptional regulator